jgi:hypothetical protein
MLASVIEVDDLDRARKVLAGEIPDPDRAVANHHLLLRSAPTAPPSFGIEPQAERFGCLDSRNIGSGAFVAHGPALLVGCGLGENTTELDFACVRWLSVNFAGAAFGFRLHHGHARAVHFDVEDRHGGATHQRQFQLFGAADLDLLTGLDASADRL